MSLNKKAASLILPIIGGCLIFFFLISRTTSIASGKQPAEKDSSGQHHIVAATFGCTSRETINRFTQLLAEKDKPAAVEFISQQIEAGDCADLDPGELVYIESSTLTGLTKVRPQGKVTDYWTNMEAVSK